MSSYKPLIGYVSFTILSYHQNRVYDITIQSKSAFQKVLKNVVSKKIKYLNHNYIQGLLYPSLKWKSLTSVEKSLAAAVVQSFYHRCHRDSSL